MRPAHPPRVLTVVVHSIVRALGGWCDVHALPHRYTLDIYLLSDDGPRHLATRDGCDEEDP